MNCNYLKITVFTLLFVLYAGFSFAQSNYRKISAGLGAGANFSYTDVYKGKWGFTTFGTIDWNLTPYVSAGLELQAGTVKGGDIHTDPHNREFANQYSSATINLKVMLGELVNYDRNDFLYSIRGLYAGVGAGIINNKMTDIVRYKPSYAAFDPGYGPFPGKDKSVNFVMPVNLGISFFINDRYGETEYALSFNAQSNITIGEGLDGYDDPSSKFKNYSPDIYNAYTVGIKYFFGKVKSYRKNL